MKRSSSNQVLAADQDPLRSLRPTPTQVLLMTAAYASEPDFPSAWAAWSASLGGDLPSRADYPLLQLLSPRLRNLPDETPYVRLCRDQYRLTWATTKTKLRWTEAVVGALTAAGIPTVVLKGAALGPVFYRDPGLRTIGDIDILVAPRQVMPAIESLARHGWQQRLVEERFDSRFFHSVTLTHPHGGLLDLHAHAQHLNLAEEDDRRFWAKAIPFTLGQHQTLALSPTHQIVHQIAHAWNSTPSPRWVADCLTVMRVAPIDWDELVQTTLALQLAPVVAPALDYLKTSFRADVPERVLEVLRAAHTPLLRRRQLNRVSLPLVRATDSLEWHFFRLMMSVNFDLKAAFTHFPAYIAYVISVEGHRGFTDLIRKWSVRYLFRSR